MTADRHQAIRPRGRLDAACSLYLTVTKAVLEAFGIAALAIMVVINAAEIVTRLLTHGSLIWVQELSIVLAMFIYFAIYGLVAKERSYIYLDLWKFRDSGLRRVSALLTQVAVIGFHGLLLVCALKASLFAWLFVTPLLQLPETVYLVPVVIGSADIVVTETIHAIRNACVGGVADEHSRSGILS